MLPPSVVTRLTDLEARFVAEERRLGESAPSGAELVGALRSHARLTRLIEPFRRWRKAQDDLAQARTLLDDPDLREIAREDLTRCEAEAASQAEAIRQLLVQSDSANDRSAILEIRAGTGGHEACLFAGDLARMYQLYATRQGWAMTPLSLSEGEVGGFKEAIFQIKGEGAFGLLRFESGGHRVQRVPTTEAQGRIHTSAATVAVMPEAGEVDVRIEATDLRIDKFRAGGAGGQHVNKTESAVRITHLPSGLVVSCQDEKSQYANLDRAMKILRARLFEAERARLDAERAAARREQVGTGDRSDRIRTYNFPQNRITDHRVNFTAYHLDRYMEGHLEELQEAMLAEAKQRVLKDWDGTF